MLDRQVQADFSQGMWRGIAASLIPARGAYDIVGFLQETGTAIGRGGSEYRSSTNVGDVTWIWTGALATGTVTLLGNDDGDIFLMSGATITDTTHNAIGPPVALNGYAYFPDDTKPAFDGTTWSTWDSNFAGILATAGGRVWRAYAQGVASTSRVEFSVLAHTGTGDLTSASDGVGAVNTTSGGFQVGQQIVGVGIPPGTTIDAVGAGTLSLSANATATGTGVALTATGGKPKFDATDYHELPGGVEIRGMVGFRDSVMVFTSKGVFRISNVAANLTDDNGNVQQRIDLISRDVVLARGESVTAWQDALIVAAFDGVYMVRVGVQGEVLGQFELISRPIAPLYRGTFDLPLGTVGFPTVFKNHYLLPYLVGTDEWEILVCRLDLPDRPWTRLEVNTRCVAVAPKASDPTQLALVAVENSATPKVMDAHWFDTGVDTDADGTAVDDFLVETRDFATGPLNENTVVKVRALYDLESSGGMRAQAIVEDEATTLTPDGPAELSWSESWLVRKKTRFVRFRFTVTGATDYVKLRTLEVFTRSQGRV